MPVFKKPAKARLSQVSCWPGSLACRSDRDVSQRAVVCYIDSDTRRRRDRLQGV